MRGWAAAIGQSRASGPRWAGVAAPILLLLLAAGLPPVRPFVLGLLVVGLLLLRGWRPARWAWAAAIPVAVSLAWGLIPVPETPLGSSECTDPLSPPAVWRLGQAAVVLAVLGGLAVWLPSQRGRLGLRWPARSVLALAVGGAILVGPVAVVVGPALAAPFFGSFELDVRQPGAIVPALVFAVSNASMEELAYRGALQGWLGRVVGWRLAVAVQAVAFGLAHGAGPDFVGSPLPVTAAMIAGGAIAGFIVVRTGSLALPLAIHAAFDIPLYYYWACRIA